MIVDISIGDIDKDGYNLTVKTKGSESGYVFLYKKHKEPNPQTDTKEQVNKSNEDIFEKLSK